MLAFNIQGRYFQPLGLNFGLTTAPYVFTKVVSAAVGHLRKQGLRVSAYLDDFIIFGATPTAAQAARDQVRVQIRREHKEARKHVCCHRASKSGGRQL